MSVIRFRWFSHWRLLSGNHVSLLNTSNEDVLFLALPVSIETILIWNVTRSIQTDIPTISIDGGLRDELIDPAWTRASFVLHASSTEIDDVWLESDHQCIVWCNQLVR